MSKQMIQEKQKQAIDILNEKNIDMWLIFVRETGTMKDPMVDMLVGTNATWQSAFILTKNGDTIAVVGSLELANMNTVGTFKHTKGYLKSIKDDLLEILHKYDPKKIAINYSTNSVIADGLTHGMYLELLKHLEGTEYFKRLISSEDVIAALRGRKSPAELELMKTAIGETLKIFNEVTSFLKPGLSEKDVADFVRQKVKERNYQFAWDEEHCPAVFTGPNTAGAHSGPTERKIERGHVINMDFGIKYQDYASDLQRTWYVLKEGEDKAPAEVEKGFRVIVEAIEKSAKELKPGKQGCEIDDIARNNITGNGYEEYQHALGHQLGRSAHDGGGLLSPRWERYGKLPYMKIEEGQVYTIEPRLPIKDYGIATVEEEVVVTKEGCEFLSPRQTEIFLIK